MRVPKADDLTKVYGCVDLFLPKGDLDLLTAAIAIEDALGDRAPTERADLSIYEKAVAEPTKAAEKLQVHARALG